MADQQFQVRQPAPLLAFLLAQKTGKSRNNLKSLLKWGQIWVDGRAVTQFDYPLAAGQMVELRPPEPVEATLPFPILFEDETLLVVDKPAGLLSMATDKEKERTAYFMATEYVREKTGGRIFIVHRLDRDTSGVLLFAKNEETKHLFQDQWGDIVRRRGYLAIVEGQLSPPEGEVRSSLRETKTHLVYSVPTGMDGKEAVTQYRVRNVHGGYSLVEVDLKTGRKNQIRVHMSDLGHPIAGDKQYGATTNPVGRLALHANALELEHPETKQLLRFSAPLPANWRPWAGTGKLGKS